MIADPRVRNHTVVTRTFSASTTEITIVFTEELVQYVMPMNPFGITRGK